MVKPYTLTKLSKHRLGKLESRYIFGIYLPPKTVPKGVDLFTCIIFCMHVLYANMIFIHKSSWRLNKCM